MRPQLPNRPEGQDPRPQDAPHIRMQSCKDVKVLVAGSCSRGDPCASVASRETKNVIVERPQSSHQSPNPISKRSPRPMSPPRSCPPAKAATCCWRLADAPPSNPSSLLVRDPFFIDAAPSSTATLQPGTTAEPIVVSGSSTPSIRREGWSNMCRGHVLVDNLIAHTTIIGQAETQSQKNSASVSS